jgi:hypothetical protein
MVAVVPHHVPDAEVDCVEISWRAAVFDADDDHLVSLMNSRARS